MDAPFTQVTKVLDTAVASRVFPGAVCEVGSSLGRRWQAAFGHLTFDQGAPATGIDTIYDLASLTKPVATTTAILHLSDEGRMSLSDQVTRHCPEWDGDGRRETRIVDLLEHASGLSARLPTAPPRGTLAFRELICSLPLEYAHRARALYSDLGFILLGFCAESSAGRPFGDVVTSALTNVMLEDADRAGFELLVRVPASLRPRVAPTTPMTVDERQGQRLVGLVHDDYAALLGGFAGHAGLFGTAPALGQFARCVLRAARRETSCGAPLTVGNVSRAVTKSTVPGSSRALGWDTMLPTSSCGTKMSAAAFGHVGFTGTSLWIDPERDLYAVLLSNRVCDGSTTEQMQVVRRAFHDALG